MRAFRILLALAVAAGTFYSLNVLAVQNGYRDRLDFKNRHYRDDCQQEHHRNHSYSHHSAKTDDNKIEIDLIDSVNKVNK